MSNNVINDEFYENTTGWSCGNIFKCHHGIYDENNNMIELTDYQ